MIGIITAMNCEAAYFESVMTNTQKKKIGAWEFTIGKLGNTDVVQTVCGVGKVFAGACTQAMIMSFGCTHIYNIGVAGSLDRNVKIGDIVCADAAVQHDMDTSEVGDPVGLISGINIIELPCDKELTQKFEAFLSAQGKTLKKGIIATGDRFIKKSADKQYISTTFGAVAGEMEGGAVAHICYINEVPCSVIRMITDNADEGSSDDYSVNLEECAVSLAKTFAEFISTEN